MYIGILWKVIFGRILVDQTMEVTVNSVGS